MPSPFRSGPAAVTPHPSRPRFPARTILVGAALGLSLSWAAGATYYLVFHDEVLARFVSQQSAMQFGYEERIGALRSQLERAASDRSAVRGGIESRLATLAERQTLIETRQNLLAGLGGQMPDAALPLNLPPEPAPVAEPPRSAKPFPTPDAPELRMRGEDRAEAAAQRAAALERRLDRLTESLFRAVGSVAGRAADSAGRFRGLILQAGLDPARFQGPREAVGGPLVPLGADAFASSLAQAQRQVEEETQLRRVVAALPFRRPLPGEPALTSAFGARLDPFTRGYALHTGLDMRAETGAPARATAAGRITAAEHAGGYGNMVEIDHGDGLATRYAHLSGFAVSPGQRVEPGAVIGYVGSTGRSTGSHLHYETRIDGEPVDPQRFLRAGAQLDFAD